MIVRVEKGRDNPYVMIRSASLDDERLSWEARGMLAYLLSKPDNWQVRASHLANVGNAGEDKVLRILRELERAGYLKRERGHDQAGRITWTSTVYETPEEASPGQATPYLAKPGMAAPGMANPAVTKKERTKTEVTKKERATHDTEYRERDSKESAPPPPEPQPLYPCSECSRTFRSLGALHAHDHKVHGNNHNHPAVEAYRRITEQSPNQEQRRVMAERVTDIKAWEEAVSHWMRRGWKPTNVDGMLERYRKLAEERADSAPVVQSLPDVPAPMTDAEEEAYLEAWDKAEREKQRDAILAAGMTPIYV